MAVPKGRAIFGHWLLAIFCLTAICSTSSGQALSDYVIEITADGMGSTYVQAMVAAGDLPSIARLQNEGAWTYNARCDYGISVTLPNHTSIVTGRGVYGTGSDGHNWSNNTTVFYPEASAMTIHSNKGSYVSSVFDVAHEAGPTALVSGKIKLSLIDESYNQYHGLGGDKIDYSSIPTAADDLTSAARINTFIGQMNATPFTYSLVHIVDPDKAGSWGGTGYNNSLRAVDGYVGQILDMIDSSPILHGHTSVILTADHGGSNNSHSAADAYLNYTIPFMVWGPGVSANTDLYSLNTTSRTDPGSGRPGYSGGPAGYDNSQPIRNSDGANLALDLLGLSAIPGSRVNALQDLAVSGAGNRPRQVLGYSAFNESAAGLGDWSASSGESELGFHTTVLGGPWGSTYSLGTYDSSSSPRRFRVRGYEARTTMDAVDLTGYSDAIASIDVQIANTTYESGDYFKVVLTNGMDSIILAEVREAALNALVKDQFLHYTASIPASWTQAWFELSASTNSSAGSEIVNFDNAFITAVPEPALTALLVMGAVATLRRRTR